MDRGTFLALQYETLRKEIEDAKDKRFTIVTGGAAIIPALQVIGEQLELTLVTLVLPFIVFVVAFLFISENNGIMRAGRYIRTQIEPQVDGVIGWETWLEMHAGFDSRLVDKMYVAGFYIVCSIYYGFAMVLGLVIIHDWGRPLVFAVATVVYALLFVALAFVAIRQPKVRTSLSTEPAATRKEPLRMRRRRHREDHDD